MPRLLSLPATGTLLAVTDLHGNLADYRAVEHRFRALGPGAHLLFCGDLVHGPAVPRHRWPEHLGSFYADRTPELLTAARRLAEEFPGRVHFLLGNHEHAHLGGPRLSKFHDDEAAALEARYGDFAAVRGWLSTWALAAVAPAAGIAFTHGAPHARISGPADLEAVDLRGNVDTPAHRMTAAGPLGALLWARTTTPERARAFLRALHPDARVAVFGHDVVREGHWIEHEPLLCVSTSFGCHDGDKLYLEWDLSRAAKSAAEVALVGLRPLYPSARRVHRVL
jgi:hypothetical protein